MNARGERGRGHLGAGRRGASWRPGGRVARVLVLVGTCSAAVAVGSVLIGGIGGSGAAGASASAPGCGGGSPHLTVQGTGIATSPPNLMTLDLDVTTTGSTAVAALGANDTAAGAVVAALTAGGVAAKDVQTTNLSIQPTYNTTGTVITGYSVDETIVAKLRHFTSAGSVIDGAVTAGGDATRIDSISLTVTDARTLQDRARLMAVRQAVGHASSMVKAAHERLGPICSLKDDTTTSTPPGVTAPVMRAGYAASAAPSVPVEQGTNQVTDRVSIVYALEAAATATA